MKNESLWLAIKNFAIDNPTSAFPFSERLARDNDWPLAFSQTVILEYKKFIYLCCISEETVTPSDEVDQAWHLHLAYTESYWTKLCGETLKKTIHHHPTAGGEDEKTTFMYSYNYTFSLYEEEFGEKPPKETWPDGTTRFEAINYKRINLDKYWLISHPQLAFLITGLSLIGLLLYNKDFVWMLFFFPFVFVFLAFFLMGLSNTGDSDNSGSVGCGAGCGGCGG